MHLIANAVDFLLHLDVHLAALITGIGVWTTYLILFLIIVGETGLVIAPLLPGDSLLFACGALSAQGLLSMWILLPLLWIASVVGDSLNYTIGKWLGVKAFRKDSRFLNHDHLEQSREFFRKHGGKSIILARFLPIVRTCAPFVAGVGHMPYGAFFLYNVIGGALWVTAFTFIGYFFGQLPAVQHNFSLVIVGLVGVSLLPAVWHWVRTRLKRA